MEKHNGWRLQDVVILLKILTFSNKDWKLANISNPLIIYISEVSGALESRKKYSIQFFILGTIISIYRVLVFRTFQIGKFCVAFASET